MPAGEEVRTPLVVIGGEEALDESAIVAGAHRCLRRSQRLRLPRRRLPDAIRARTLFHHPLWIAKVVTAADRPPFPPKQTPNLVFVDAVSGYRGVLEAMPALTEVVPTAEVVAPVLATEAVARRYVAAVLQRVDRSYLLKKPRHDIREIRCVHLPLWRVQVDVDGGVECVVNGSTGAPESYMAALWGTRRWLDLGS